MGDGPGRSQECCASAAHSQATGGQKSDLHLERDALKWMKEQQCSYTDEQLSFWTLLHPLTDGSETSSWHLACWLLSVWHWSSVLNPPVCPPAPSQLNIGCWFWEDSGAGEHQKWIEAYTCTLQWLAEASVGHAEYESVGLRHWMKSHSIVKCLDKVATCQLSLTAWDMFTFPEEDEEHWREDCLSYYLGKVVNIRARMPEIWLVMQDMKGQYSSSARILLYKGQMLAYDPVSNLMKWVPMWGMSLSLTSTELKSANDLSNIFLCPPPWSYTPKKPVIRTNPWPASGGRNRLWYLQNRFGRVGWTGAWWLVALPNPSSIGNPDVGWGDWRVHAGTEPVPSLGAW